MKTTIAAIYVVAFSAGLVSAQSFDITGMDPGLAAAATLVEQRCATCHTMKRVVNATHAGQDWAPVVTKMRKKEKAGISESEGARITAFLAAWSSPQARQPDRVDASAKGPDPAQANRPATRLRRASPSSTESLPPGTIGGPACFDPRHFAIVSRHAVLPGSVLPMHIQTGWHLGDLAITSVRTDQSKEGVLQFLATVQGSFGTQDIALSRDASNRVVAAPFLLSTWSVGQHRFRLLLALHDALENPLADQRPSLGIALLVAHESP